MGCTGMIRFTGFFTRIKSVVKFVVGRQPTVRVWDEGRIISIIAMIGT